MRLLHSFGEEKDATRFVDVLFAEEINASVREGQDRTFGLWIDDDDDLEPAQQMLAVFLENPNDPRFGTLEKEATSKRKKHKKAEKKSRHQVRRAKDAFSSKGLGPVTMAVIATCAFVAFVTKLGETDARFYFLFVDLDLWDIAANQMIAAGQMPRATGSTEWLLVTWAHGGVWRIISPIFLHYGFFHILFNLWWWKDLGGALERIHSWWWLLTFTLLIGVGSNFAEYYLGDSVGFGGLSGVVYGVFGYFWARGHNDPNYPDRLPRMTIVWMMAWYILCWAGFIPIANWAHTGGLLLGGLWGILSSGVIRRQWLRKRVSLKSLDEDRPER